MKLFIIPICIVLIVVVFYLKNIYYGDGIDSLRINETVQYFENSRLNSIYDNPKCNYPILKETDLEIPVFLLSKDRLYAVKYSVFYWMKLRKYNKLNIIILDHKSSIGSMKSVYKELERYNIKIIYLKSNTFDEIIRHEIPHIIDDYLDENKQCKYYIFGDIDCVLNNVPMNIIQFYATVLKNCNDVDVIGPALMISDLPSNKEKVYDWEKRFFLKNHVDILFDGNYFTIVNSLIDTTIAMRRRDNKLKRFKGNHYRTLAPYISHHLDWYITPDNIPRSFKYYVNRSQKINHSGYELNLKGSAPLPNEKGIIDKFLDFFSF